MSADEWLALIDADSDQPVPDFCFPNERAKSEYVDSIETRTEAEVRDLLRRHFLIHTGEFGADEFHAEHLKRLFLDDPEGWRRAMEREYWRRLAGVDLDLAEPTWQGLTWVLDLLPGWPLKAVEAIEAYLMAHIIYLPDGRIWGLADAQAVIRAMWIGNATSGPLKRDLVLQLGSARFEHLVEALYRAMGFDTVVTARTRDGGRDIEVKRDAPAKREFSLVECKLWSGTVGVEEVRKLLGVVAHGPSPATKGVLVTSGSFTRPARDFAASDHRVELLPWEALLSLLDEHLGANWSLNVDWHISDSMMRSGFEQE